MNRSRFLTLLRKISKKGFYEVLLYVKEKGEIHYADVLDHAIKAKIVESRATVTVILNGLTDLGLLERKVSQKRPIRTTYKLGDRGLQVLHYLQEIEKSID